MTATVVASGRAAVEALTAAAQTRQPFDLVLLNADMPDMDGFEVAAEVRKRPELASATVMMLTSSGNGLAPRSELAFDISPSSPTPSTGRTKL